MMVIRYSDILLKDHSERLHKLLPVVFRRKMIDEGCTTSHNYLLLFRQSWGYKTCWVGNTVYHQKEFECVTYNQKK